MKPKTAENYYPNLNNHNEKLYMERTKRNHFWLKGPEGQKEIRNLKIAVAGLGGMGGQTTELLARMGVGDIRISDPDAVDVSNINRQIVATQKTVGTTKRESMTNRILDIGEDFNLTVYPGVTAENVDDFVEGCSAVIDEIDVYPLQAHRILHEACRKRNIPIYSAYVVGMGIHFYKFHGKDYILDDFLGRDEKVQWDKPTAEYLLRKYGPPMPSYIQGSVSEDFKKAIETGSVPIFGPATLIGQSLIATRVIVDLVKCAPEVIKTPTMPEYIAVDYADLSLKVCRVPNT